MDLERYLFEGYETVQPGYNLPSSWMKALFTVQEKIPAICGRLLYCVGAGLPTASSASHEERNGRGNVRKRKEHGSTHESCRPQMPSTKQMNSWIGFTTTKIGLLKITDRYGHYNTIKKDNPYAIHSALLAPFRTSTPRYVAPASSFFSTVLCGGELNCVLLCSGWDRPDGKQQLWRWRVALCSAVLRVGRTGREAANVAVESCIVFCCVEGGIDRTGSSNCGGGELHCVLLC